MTAKGNKQKDQIVSFKRKEDGLSRHNVLHSINSRDFILALKYGYLSKKSKTIFKNVVERFYVLSNIGLLYMKNPNDKEVKLFPIIDFDVVPTKNQKWTFELRTIKGKSTDMVVTAYSERDYNEWIEAFKSFKK